MKNLVTLLALALTLLAAAAQDSPIFSRIVIRRGMEEFRAGKIKESVNTFEAAARMDPEVPPTLWQLGISYYYAGEFEKGRKQFELHQTINPEDAENAMWHFLCISRLQGVEAARKVLIPISQDPRIPMKELHGLFAGKMTRDDVLKAARAGNPSETALKERLFYAHLYLGLYEEALQHPKESLAEITLAGTDYAQNDYMGAVAKIHLQVRKQPSPPKN